MIICIFYCLGNTAGQYTMMCHFSLLPGKINHTEWSFFSFWRTPHISIYCLKCRSRESTGDSVYSVTVVAFSCLLIRLVIHYSSNCWIPSGCYYEGIWLLCRTAGPVLWDIFFLSFKISCNYNDGKAMLNDLIVLEVIAHIFPMHKKMKQLLRKRIKIFLILSKKVMEFALYLSICHQRIICISFNLLMSGIRLQSPWIVMYGNIRGLPHCLPGLRNRYQSGLGKLAESWRITADF